MKNELNFEIEKLEERKESANIIDTGGGGSFWIPVYNNFKNIIKYEYGKCPPEKMSGSVCRP